MLKGRFWCRVEQRLDSVDFSWVVKGFPGAAILHVENDPEPLASSAPEHGLFVVYHTGPDEDVIPVAGEGWVEK